MKNKVCIVIPNWNGASHIGECLDSLLAQSYKAHIIVVDNGSVDDSVLFIKSRYQSVELIEHSKNLGFAGGVNVGIRRATELGAEYVALFNNDAVADSKWLENLIAAIDDKENVGITTGKLLDDSKQKLDSTGDWYTTWGLPYPRGRGEVATNKYDNQTEVFAASGGASLYRIKMLNEIGIFDEDFFAYYEDVDISFRAQLAGWKIHYVPKAIAYHQIGATSSKLKGFTTHQTMKNLPMLLLKNVPLRLLPGVWIRFQLTHWAFLLSAISRGQGWPALKGCLVAFWLLPKKLIQRYTIQSRRKVTSQYIWSIMTHDLPPNAHKLRALRARWWRITGRRVTAK